MNRFRLGAVVALAATTLLTARAPQALAAAEVHKLSFVISGIPTSIAATDMNTAIDYLNAHSLELRGRQGLDKIQLGWLFDAEFHYFVRENVAVNFGAGQLRSGTKREYLPAIQQDIQIRSEVLSVPIHVGGDYYFTAYNQGDFRARAYLGGGFLSLVANKALIEQVETGTDPSTTIGGSFKIAAVRDAPGFFLEGGVHMFFASRFSVLLGGMYRSARVGDMLNRVTHEAFLLPNGKPFALDVSGVGAKMALAIGL